MAKGQNDSLREVIDETAFGLFRSGLIDREAYDQITLRDLPESERLIEIPVPTGDEIRAMRRKAKMSQAMFARQLNLTPGYISQLERGIKRPSGPVLVLFQLIERRGIEALR